MISALLLLAASAPQDSAADRFGFAGSELYLAHAEAKSIVVADFNGDGLTDFGFLHPGRSRIDLFLQKTALQIENDRALPPHFDELNQIHDDDRFAKETVALDRNAYAMTAADFDGDGVVDLAVLSDPAHVALWRRQGGAWNRAWQTEMESVHKSTSSRALAAADFNGDGRPDLAVLRDDGAALFLQQDSAFGPPVALLSTLHDAHAIAAPDLDGDGRADLVLVKEGQETGIAARLQRGGALGWEYAFETGPLRETAFSDLDGQPGDEILAVHNTTGRLHGLRLTRATLDEADYRGPLALLAIPARHESRGVALGDVNGDGRADLVLSDPERATLDVFLQTEAGVLEAPRAFSTYAGVRDVVVAGGAVYSVSPTEQALGVARWTDGRLPFPTAVDGVTGSPRCAVVGDFGLAYATEDEQHNWFLVVGDARTALPRLPEGPSRLLAVDVDGDGRTDLAVTQPRDPLLLALNAADGWQIKTAQDYGGRGLVGGAAEGSFAASAIGLLFGKQNFVRAVGLGADGRLAVRDQVPGTPGTTVSAAARASSGEVFLFSRAQGEERLHVMRPANGSWEEAASIPGAGVSPTRMEVADLTGDGAEDLVLVGAGALGLLPRSRERVELSTLWTYESESREPQLLRILAGDANADGRPDVLLYDAAENNRAMEILTLGGSEPRRAASFEVFERQAQRQNLPSIRDWRLGDFTGDGKNDVVFLIDDRAVLYIQE